MDYSSTFVSSNYASTPMRAQQAEIILARFMPPSSSQSDVPVHLSTYTPGEDFGRLAKLAKEFGLARIRNQKKQIRKGIPKLAITNGQQQQQQQQPSHERQPALRYIFSGYSIWLELEQQEINNNGIGDLEFAVKEAADEFHLGGAIPAPHVTALYGITTIETDEEAINIFRNDVVKAITNRAEKRRKERTGNAGKIWPDLAATGILVGAEFDGVNGGEMDMAWTEISFATSPEHELLINELYDIFYRRDATRLAAANSSLTEEKKEEYPPRSQPWVPHLSIEGFGTILTRQSFEDFLKNKCPTLAAAAESSDSTVKLTRAVSGLSLWNTAGTMADWKCLDRFEFDCVTPDLSVAC